jgi:hypothetical protein
MSAHTDALRKFDRGYGAEGDIFCIKDEALRSVIVHVRGKSHEIAMTFV